MNLIGPKSLASALYIIVGIAFILATLSTLAMLAAPLFFQTALKLLTFNVESGPLHVAFAPQSFGAGWWLWIMELVSRASRAVVLYCLIRVLRPVKAGEVFHPKTAGRLQWMAGIIVICSLLRTFFCVGLLKQMTSGPGMKVRPGFDMEAILLGIVLLVLGEVFNRGYVLKTDSELTV